MYNLAGSRFWTFFLISRTQDYRPKIDNLTHQRKQKPKDHQNQKLNENKGKVNLN